MDGWNRVTFLFAVSILALCLLSSGQSANVLFMMPYGSLSHGITMLPVMKALDAKGHDVTYLTMVNPKVKMPKSVHVLHMKVLEDFIEEHKGNMSSQRGLNITFLSKFMPLLADAACRKLMEEPQFRKVVEGRQTRPIDVVIVDPLMADCGLSIIPLLGNSPPLIYYCTTGVYTWTAHDLNIPTPLSYVTNQLVPFTQRMSFLERARNLLGALSGIALRSWYAFPVADRIVREYHPGIAFPPSLADIARNASLVLVNTILSVDPPRPLAPNLIEVGGTHLTPSKRLPDDLETFVNGSDMRGFVFFSLGTNIRGVDLAPQTLALFLKVFRDLGIRVIWKLEFDLPSVPPNVLVRRWAPQQDLLGHPKCALFITQGGQLSLQEAVYHGVPVLGLPVVGEQEGNVKTAMAKGYAEVIPPEELNEETFREALTKMTTSTAYKQNVKKHSVLARELLGNPVEKAVFWIEHVIRHKGAEHLGFEAAKQLNFFQYFLLDVVAAAFVVVLVLAYCLWKLAKLVYVALRRCLVGTPATVSAVSGKKKRS